MKKLKEKYINIENYYNESFDLFKKFVVKNKWLILLFIGLAILGELLIIKANYIWDIDWNGIFTEIYDEEEIGKMLVNFQLRKVTLKFPLIIINFMMSIILSIFIKKIYNVKENENRFDFFDILVRKIIYLFIRGIFIAISIIFSVILTLILVILLKVKGILILLIFGLFSTVFLFIIWYYSIYLDSIYFIRELELYEAFRYNLVISKDNRLKYFLSSLLLFALKYLLLLPIMILMFTTLHPFTSYFSFFLFLIKIIFINVVLIFYIVLKVVIYLNVEKNDLKKVKNIEKSTEN